MAFLKMSKGGLLYLRETLNVFGRRLAQGFTLTRLRHTRAVELLHPAFFRFNRFCAAETQLSHYYGHLSACSAGF